MLTTKKRAQNFLIFSLGILVVAGATGCAPAGARALLKGERLIKEGKYAEAVTKFEEATQTMPENAKAWNHLGLGYQYAGDPGKAAQAYQKALALDRNLTAATYNLGNLYLEQRNLPEALASFTTFVQLEGKNPDGWLKLGTAQMQMASLASAPEKNRLLDAAKKNLENAQKLRPSAEALNALGMIQIQRSRPRDAVPNFTAALQHDPDYAPASLNLAVVYHQYLNERPLALVNYRKYLSVAKNSPEAAQVQLVARQLESELNPPVAVAHPTAVPPATVVSSKPPASNSPSAPTVAKVETNLPKVMATPKSAPTVSAPKAPPVSKKEPPVEVAQVPEEVPVKSARDISPSNSTKPLAVNSNPTVAPTTPVLESTPEKGSGVLAKLNPVSWFKKKPHTTEAITELPAFKPTIEDNATTEESRAASAPSATDEQTSDGQSKIPRYRYRSLKKPSDGKRAEAEPVFAQGVKAQREKRLRDALTAYGKAIKLDPGFFEAHYNFALAAREAGDLSATLHAYEYALAITPESVNARYNFAFTLQEMGYFVDSANELRKLLKENPNETRAHLLLGNLCAQRLSQTSSAREHYLKVLSAEPRHPQATQIRYWLAAQP